MAAKGLSRISQSRERFLLEKGGGDGGANALGPTGNLVSGLRVFVRIQEGPVSYTHLTLPTILLV